MSLPQSVAWAFPEYDVRELDAERDARLVLGRLLEQGRLQDVRWAVQHYGLQRIHRFFRDESSPELSQRTIALWRVALNAREEHWAESRRSRLRSVAPWPS